MIPKEQKRNFETLKRAFKNGDVTLMEVTDNATGETVDAICAVQSANNEEYEFIPFAFMVRCNPYERFTPPQGVER